MHIHNIRDFPQAKSNSKINTHFLLNKHGDLYFITQFWCNNYPLSVKKLRKNVQGGKNDIAKRVNKTENNNSRNFLS